MSAQLALIGDEQPVHPAVIMTAHYGHNDRLIASVGRLYIRPGALVVDVTYGRGMFWRRTDTSRFRLLAFDLLPMPGASARADFRALPLEAAAADVVVLDPPYAHGTTQPRDIERAYRNSETTPGATYADIIGLYRAGMAEALRVLRPGGTCWVKCQDAVEGKQQKWSAIILHAAALQLGFEAQDLFVLVVPSPPGKRSAARQYHARRNHSYLWIFRKPAR